MNRCDRDEDDAYDRMRQREVDEARETEMAFADGREAGRMCLAAGLNPHEMGTAKANAWERGRSAVEAHRTADALKRRARPICNPCTCEGRGLCRDVA